MKLAVGCAVGIPRAQLRTLNVPVHGFVVGVRQTPGPHYFLDARNHAAVRRAYGVLASENNAGLYVPIGRQDIGGNFLGPVPICVGGGRDMELTAGGLVDETDQQVVEREAQEEIHQTLDIHAVNALVTPNVPGHQASYLLVTLRRNLSRVYFSWDVANSDQVIAMRWWPLPYPQDFPVGHRGGPGNPVLAMRLYDDLGCSAAHRAAWRAEWHAEAYQVAINAMLLGSVAIRPLYNPGIDGHALMTAIATRRYTYGTAYAPFPTQNFIGHVGHGGGCNFPWMC